MNLILYNFVQSEISQTHALQTVQGLLQHLSKLGVQSKKINLIDGNTNHSQCAKLVREIVEYWYNIPEKSTASMVRSSLWSAQKYLLNELSDFRTLDLLDNKGILRSKIIKAKGVITDPIFLDSIIITGNLIKIYNPYGDAIEPSFEDEYIGGICINSCVSKESIWHEVAHLLGAEDHYDSNYKCISECKEPKNCFMQWDSNKGSCFCDRSIEEMKRFLAKVQRLN